MDGDLADVHRAFVHRSRLSHDFDCRPPAGADPSPGCGGTSDLRGVQAQVDSGTPEFTAVMDVIFKSESNGRAISLPRFGGRPERSLR